MKTLLTTIAIGAGLYLLVGLALYTFQRRLIYYPDPTYLTPDQVGLTGVEEVKLKTPDGETLIAWWSRAAAGQPTLIYFHGNAGGLANRAPRVERFADAGLGVFMLAYRGYSGSTGQPTENALIADALLAYDYLRENGLQAQELVPYGESLGSGVAVQLAAQRSVGALVLDAPYTSLPDIGKRLYPFIPVERFMTDRFDSMAHISKVEAPILIMHGSNDVTIPLELGKTLFEAAPEPKEMAVIEGAGHSDIYMFGAMEHLQRFLARFRPRSALPEKTADSA